MELNHFVSPSEIIYFLCIECTLPGHTPHQVIWPDQTNQPFIRTHLFVCLFIFSLEANKKIAFISFVFFTLLVCVNVRKIMLNQSFRLSAHRREITDRENRKEKAELVCNLCRLTHSPHIHFILFLSIFLQPTWESPQRENSFPVTDTNWVCCGKCVQSTARTHEVRCRKFKSIWIYYICMTRVRWRKYAWMIKNLLLLATATG